MNTKIRSVKPDLFQHRKLFKFDKAFGHKGILRLTFIALFTCCDREGRSDGNQKFCSFMCCL